MKAFKVMFVVFAMLLLAVPIATAQEGWAGCPWGSDYDPMSNGYVPACFTKPTSTLEAAAKPAGLAKPAPALTGEQNLTLDWVDRQVRNGNLAAPAPVVTPEQGSPCGANSTPIYAAGYVSCVNADQTTSAAPKSPGLAKPAPALTGEQNLTLDWVDRQIRNGNLAAPR